MDTISVISLTVGVASFASSIVFYVQARKAEQSNRETLDKVHKAINDWQSRIMESAIEMIESRPEIIAKRSHSENSKAKQEIIYNLLERVKYIIEQPFSKEDSIAQTARLNTLLEAVTSITKSEIPPEVYTKLAERRANTQPDQTKSDPDQSSKG